MPPLPPKKSFEANVERSVSVSSTASGSAAAAIDGAGITSTESYLSYKPSNDGDAQAVHEAIVDPSCWVLKNSRTGQEVKAATFMEAVLARRPCPQWPMSSPQLGSSLSGSRGWPRRYRNKALQIQRPTFLPQGDAVSFAPGLHIGPPSPPPPPTLHLSFSSLPGKSPMRARGRSSLPASTLSRARSTSNSDSTGSAILSVSDGPRPFKLGNMSTTQIVPSLHVGGIRAICFSPSGEYLATCGVDKRCCVFRVRQCRRATADGGSPTASVEGEAEDCTSRRRSVSLAGRLIEDKPMRILTGHVDAVVALAWVGGDNELLSASTDGTVRSWRPLEGDECAGVYEHGGGVTSVAWEPASTQAGGGGAVRAGRFITGCLDAKVRLFSLGNLEPEQSVLAEKPVTAVAFCAGGQSFAAGCVSGTVVFYRTEGMVPQLTVECRRHGFRHSAAQRTRLATSPVRRMSAGNGIGIGNDNVEGNANGSVNGRGGARRRRNTMGPKARGRASGPAEERVTGLCFRPQAKGLAELGAELSDSDGDASLLLGTIPPSIKETEKTDDTLQERAPSTSVGGEVRAPEVDGQGTEGDGDKAWLGPLADLLVSTNDNRSRILVSGAEGEVVVGFKLKGHNTEGALGRHHTARYSEDGDLVISGSTDGNVHVFTTPSALGSSTPRRAVAWTNGREGHERAQVCEKNVAVPVALFAPARVVRNLGGSSSRVILTGDELGYMKIFCERNVD